MTDAGGKGMFDPLSPEEFQAGKHSVPRDNTDDYRPIVPVPGSAPPPNWRKLRPKEAVGDPLIHTYRTKEGGVAFYVARWKAKHPKQKKIIRAVTWDGYRWQLKAIPWDRPLYNLTAIYAAPKDYQIWVVEGEKCAEALAREIEKANKKIVDADKKIQAVVVTWSGGAAACRFTDFSPLAGRGVALLSDADTPGRDAMKATSKTVTPTVGGRCSPSPIWPEANGRTKSARRRKH